MDGHGEGNLTGWVAATPLAAPSLTAMPEATANGATEIDLGWTATAGAGTYTLLRGTTGGGEVSYQPGLTGTSFNDTGLTTGTKYYYKIKAINGGSSATSDEVSATAGGTPLAAPTLSGTATNGEVSLSWTSVATSSYYDLYRVPNPGNDAAGIYQRLSSTTYSYTDTNVTNGTSYTYRVAGGNSGGQGTLSNSLVLTPLASPTVTATPTSAPSVSVSWTTVTGVTNYQLQRATSTSGPWSVMTVTSSTSYSDTSVSFATDYYYCVHALCTGTDSGPSNVALAETCPAAPTSLTAMGGNGQVALSWVEPGGDVGGVSVYKGTSSGGEGGTYIAHGVLGTTYTDTSVTNGTTYYYNIAATDLGGASARSNEASATPTASAPGPPTLATPTAGNGKVTLTWTAGTGSVTSYNLYRSTSSNGEGSTPIETGVTGTGWTDTGLTNGTTYYYEVTAVNGIGESTKSNEQSAAPVNVTGAPGAVTNIYVVEGNGHIALFWIPVSGAATYNVYRSAGGGNFSRIQTSISTGSTLFGGLPVIEAYDPSLSNGTGYTYYITGVSSSSVEGAASLLLPAIPANAATPAAPQYPSASAPTTTSATVGFNGSPGTADYDLYRSTASGTEQSSAPVLNLYTAGGFGRMSLSDPGTLISGTTYYYDVTIAVPLSLSALPPNAPTSGVTYYAEGAVSTDVSVTPGGTPPTQPTLNTPNVNGNFSASVSWGAISGASSYNVYYTLNPPAFPQAVTVVLNTTVPSATIPNIPYGGGSGSVQVQVSAVNSAGEGTKSAAVSATLYGYGIQPAPATVAVGQGQHGSVTMLNPTANGFIGPITWSVSGMPSGVTAWMESPSSTVTYSDVFTADHTANGVYPANDSEGSTLFIWVAPNTPMGTYQLTVTGTAGTGASYAFTQTVTIPLTVTAGSSAAPRRKPIYLARALEERRRWGQPPIRLAHSRANVLRVRSFTRVFTHGHGG